MLINGVNASTFGFVLSAPPGWLDAPATQIPSTVVLKRGPVITGDALVQPRRVTLRGYVRGTSAANVRTKLDSLKLALSFPPVSVVFDDSATRDHSLYLDTFAVPPQPAGAFIAKDLAVEIGMTAFSPYARDLTATTVSGSAALPMGTGPVRPVVTLNGATNPSISLRDKNGAAVTSMFFTLAGTAVIDCDLQTILVGGVSNMAALDSGDFFVIEPGDPKFQGTGPTITATGVSSYSTTYKRAWR